MDVQDDTVLDVDLLADDGSEEEGEAPPSSGTISCLVNHLFVVNASIHQLVPRA